MIENKISYPGYFNNKKPYAPKIEFNEDKWAVTMICNSNSSSISFSNHAQLVIEGVKDEGKPFKKIIHLTGLTSKQEGVDVAFAGSRHCGGMKRIGKVKTHDVTDKEIDYTHKSKTWVRSSEKVAEMLSEVEKEEVTPEENPRPFYILGRQSKFAGKVDTFTITDPLTKLLSTNDDRLFKKIYERAQKCRDGTFPGIDRLDDPYFYPLQDDNRNDGGFDISKKTVSKVRDWWIYKNQISNERSLEVINLFAETSTPEEREQLVINAVRTEKNFFNDVKNEIEKTLEKYNNYILYYFNKSLQKIVENNQKMEKELLEKINELKLNFEKNALQECRRLIKHIYEYTDLKSLSPDNCFTWSCEKLSKIGVKIPTNGLEKIVSATKLYLDPVKQPKNSKATIALLVANIIIGIPLPPLLFFAVPLTATIISQKKSEKNDRRYNAFSEVDESNLKEHSPRKKNEDAFIDLDNEPKFAPTKEKTITIQPTPKKNVNKIVRTEKDIEIFEDDE